MDWRRHKDQKKPEAPRSEPDASQSEPVDQGGEAAEIPVIDAELDAAQQQIAKLQAERDDLNQRYLRTLADYQNSQRRALSNEKEAKQQGITSVVLNALTVLDHFDLALNQDPSKATAESIISGVKVIRDELMKVLQNHGVQLIPAAPNGVFDPAIHQAVMQTENPDIEPGHIVAALQPGYQLNDRVIRPAMVSIRPKSGEA
jgi:molecular chaperone GrpE